MGVKMYLGNLFDRHPAFKEIAKECLTTVYLAKLKDLANSTSKKYLTLSRDTLKSIKEKEEEINVSIKKSSEYQ